MNNERMNFLKLELSISELLSAGPCCSVVYFFFFHTIECRTSQLTPRGSSGRGVL